MLKNYILFAYRSLIRQKVYSIISISGLSLGMACFLIIVLYFQFQFSYDQFHENKERIYRINQHLDGSKGERRVSYTAPFVADYIKDKIAEVEEVIRFSSLPLEMHYQDKSFAGMLQYACDPQVFNVFSFKLIKGNAQNALVSPNSIVLTESMALKFFGAEDPMDKIILTYNQRRTQIPLKVTGIMEDVPQNSHIQIGSLISMSTIKYFFTEYWYENDWHGCHTYLLLKENADHYQVQKQIDQILLEKVPLLGFNEASLPLQPITSIFFNPTKDGSSQRGSKAMTVILLVLGLFILIIASLNYINLSIARSLKRTREIGIRKVLGAEKNQLIRQFLGESVLISFAALIFSMILMQLFIPYLNKFSNIFYKINLDSEFLQNQTFVLLAIGTAILTGLLSGFYPAIIMSGFNSVKALRGSNDRKRSFSMRKGLVVIQYVVSVIMIVGSIGIYKMYHFMTSQDLGFNKDHVLAIHLDDLRDNARIRSLKDILNNNSDILTLSTASKVPMSMRDDDIDGYYVEDPENGQKNRIIVIDVDPDYFNLLEVPYIEHPDDLATQDNDNPVMIVNETFMSRYGAYYQKGDPVEILKYNDQDQMVPVIYPKIIGSVKNFKGRNLILEKPAPKAYIVSSENQRYILARLNPQNQQETLKFVETEFNKVFPEKVFQYSFVDDEINTFMSIINPFAKLIYYGTIFAIFIASMGLFALALYITQQKTKEIGIRRVFGASVQKISIQLAKQFIKLVLLAFFIAGPITFYGFRKMLQIIPEKIVLQWSLLLAIGVAILFLAIGTVFIQSWHAAKTNPVLTLRYE